MMQDYRQLNEELMTFLDESPCSLWAIRSMTDRLKEVGFEELPEAEPWKLEPGRNYYVTRGGTSLIAFRMPADIGPHMGFQIIASHCDSPHLRVKPGGPRQVEGYQTLNVEKYGGMINASWLDRPLSVAGRILVRTEDGVDSRLFRIDRDLLIIPDVAIHMNREINNGFVYNLQTDLAPLIGQVQTGAAAGSGVGEVAGAAAEAAENGGNNTPYRGLLALIAKEAGVDAEDILDADISLYNRTPATVLGLNDEFVASGRLDDLQSSFASLTGLLDCTPDKSAAVHCVFDSEEVGSTSRQGASSTFLRDTLRRICGTQGLNEEGYHRALLNSFMISADNAHSIHPNHPEKADPVNRPVMNGGIVIKYSSDQKYMTDAVSGAIMRRVCEKAGVPYQIFTNRSDMPGGSTLGRLSSAQVPVRTADIGLAQLSMHASYETAGVRDTFYLAKAANLFFSVSMREERDGTIRVSDPV